MHANWIIFSHSNSIDKVLACCTLVQVLFINLVLHTDWNISLTLITDDYYEIITSFPGPSFTCRKKRVEKIREPGDEARLLLSAHPVY